jgi:hypothetical protein
MFLLMAMALLWVVRPYASRVLSRSPLGPHTHHPLGVRYSMACYNKYRAAETRRF